VVRTAWMARMAKKDLLAKMAHLVHKAKTAWMESTAEMDLKADKENLVKTVIPAKKDQRVMKAHKDNLVKTASTESKARKDLEREDRKEILERMANVDNKEMMARKELLASMDFKEKPE